MTELLIVDVRYASVDWAQDDPDFRFGVLSRRNKRGVRVLESGGHRLVRGQGALGQLKRSFCRRHLSNSFADSAGMDPSSRNVYFRQGFKGYRGANVADRPLDGI